MKINRIAIVGGGTAGWLVANHLGQALQSDIAVKITLIESPDIPTIGVGEGTVPSIKKSLQKFGISEADLFAHCDATFKIGIKFVDWLDAEKHGAGHYYYHPFTSPYPSGYDITPYYLENRDSVQFHDLTEVVPVAESGRSPKRISSLPYQGEVEYAYHVNAQKFAVLLSNNAKEIFGVEHLNATVVDAEKNEDGTINCLVLKDGEKLSYDFYIDCTGFSSLLIGKALSTPFVSKANQILTDTALVQQVPTGIDDEVPPYTLATAHRAGWSFNIPVFNRRGTGFIYSSGHMSDDEAVVEYANYLGVSSEKISPRKLPMKIGYHKDFWRGNCVAFGLAHGFVEPLEATSILLTDFSADLLSKNFPRFKADIPALRKHCNPVVETAWERIIDFVQLHYLISDRKDSQFWKDNRESTYVSDYLADRLERWKMLQPKNLDLLLRSEVFETSNYLYVLYGMRFPTRTCPLTDFERKESQVQIEMVRQKAKYLSENLPSHRAWLMGLRQAMGVS